MKMRSLTAAVDLNHDPALGGWYLEAWTDFGRDHRITAERWEHEVDAIFAFELGAYNWLRVDGEDLTPFEIHLEPQPVATVRQVVCKCGATVEVRSTGRLASHNKPPNSDGYVVRCGNRSPTAR
jgi:hypothetical protein